MRRLLIPYATWASVLQANPRWPLYAQADGASGSVALWAGTEDYLYCTHVYTNDRETYDAFAATRTVVAVVSEDEAVARIVGIRAVHSTRTEDGRPMVQPVTLDRELWHWFHSRGDTLETGRSTGPFAHINATLSDPDPAPIIWQYNDWVELAGGVVKYRNAEPGDYVTFKVVAPASVPTSTPGVGNCDKVSVGPGVNLIVPAPGTGDWTVDLTDRTKAVPVLSTDQTGFWEWSWPDEGVGEVSAGVPQASHFNLFDFPIDPMARFVPGVAMLGTGVADFTPENVHPSDVLPHHQVVCLVHHAGGANVLDVVWFGVAARKNTR